MTLTPSRTVPRGKTRRDVVLETLQAAEGRWVPAQALVDAGAGYRYAARVWELRQAGHAIEERRDPDSRSALGQYRLVREGQTSWLP